MSRLLKRVPLDFQWPLNTTWRGYLNPFYDQAQKCAACDGSGYSPQAKHLSDQWYGYVPFKPEDRGSVPFTPETPEVKRRAEHNVQRGVIRRDIQAAIYAEAQRLCEIYNSQWCHHLNADDVKALLESNRLWDFTREPRTEEQRHIVIAKVRDGGNSWLPESNGYVPTPAEVNLWSISGMGHDSCNQWICVKAECKRLRVPYECRTCEGSGEKWPSREVKQQSEDWKPSEPPTGEGFQLWEDTTEGSPQSPVFGTLEELCEWCAPNATTFGRNRATAEQWKFMLKENFVRHEEGNLVFI